MTPLTDLPTGVQRVVSWCRRGCTLNAARDGRGSRYALSAPPDPRGPSDGLCRARAIREADVAAAIRSGYLAPVGTGLFGAGDAQSWRAAA